jgi:outer membrane protein OmpA-like peptidoglycan-associated protein
MTDPQPQQTVARLKELLFDREARELDTLAGRIGELQKRAGSDENFQAATARVIDRALKDAEATRHKDLADAMAPMVLRTLRTEIKSQHMQDQIAGSLYPRIGEMVSRYVSSAIRDLMLQINRRLEAGLTRNRFSLWMRSLTSGRSMAELALAETQQLKVDDIYLVRRGSGALLHHWQREEDPAQPDGSNRNTLVSGFISAITDFAEEAFAANKTGLRTLDLDAHRIYLRGTPEKLLAVKCAGSALSGIDTVLDQEINSALGDDHGIEQTKPEGAVRTAAREALLAGLAKRIEDVAQERTQELSNASARRTMRALLWLIGLPIVAFGAWTAYVSFVTNDLQTRADAAIAAIPSLKGFPVKAHVERGGQRIWVTGLVPDTDIRRRVVGDLKAVAPSAVLTDAIGILPSTDVEGRVTAETFRRAVLAANSRLTNITSDVAGARAKASDARLQAALDEIAVAAPAVKGELEALGTGGVTHDVPPGLRTTAARMTAAVEAIERLSGVAIAPEARTPQSATDLANDMASLIDRLAGLLSTLQLRQTVTPLAEKIERVDERLAERLGQLNERLAARIAELERELVGQRPRPPTAREALADFVKGHAVFFDAETDFRDPDDAAATIGKLADLLKAANASIRIVGYTDEAGTTARNTPLAQGRADKVANAIEALGVNRELLIPVGRANGVNLAPGTGPGSANRRVEFELAFEGERRRSP